MRNLHIMVTGVGQGVPELPPRDPGARASARLIDRVVPPQVLSQILYVESGLSAKHIKLGSSFGRVVEPLARQQPRSDAGWCTSFLAW